jgi:hypothetical protein
VLVGLILVLILIVFEGFGPAVDVLAARIILPLLLNGNACILMAFVVPWVTVHSFHLVTVQPGPYPTVS